MSREKAVAIFTATPKTHNCAQSVAAGFDRASLVEELRLCGGGRAPEGVCGALHAALRMVPEKDRDEVVKQFTAQAGSPYCRVLKRELNFPCTECVRLAAALTEEHLEKSGSVR